VTDMIDPPAEIVVVLAMNHTARMARTWKDGSFCESRRRAVSTAPRGGALGRALSATPARATLGWHEVVGGKFLVISTAGRR
jgi:hypothetical protein